jgi:tetratricopeptide (TPR) repeat protein
MRIAMQNWILVILFTMAAAAVAQPNSGLAYAKLANEYIGQRNAQAARLELEKAEALAPTNSFECEASLFQAYCNLHEIKPAIRHGRKCVALGKISSKDTEFIEATCQDFEARETPTFFELAAPRECPGDEFNQALRQKLSPEEMKLVINPLVGTSEMEAWARRLTAEARTDQEKARALLDGLCHRLDANDFGMMTAEEAFKNWTNMAVSIHCQEYAFLYTSLARAVGLKAFIVYVDETCYGEKTDHACAAVFFGKKVALVDPSYFWFGVPHKHFRILDDFGAVTLYISAICTMDRARIAYKLAPELPQAQSAMFQALTADERWEEAAKLVSGMEKSGMSQWSIYGCQARVAWHEKRYDAAIDLLIKAVKLNPLNGSIYQDLGEKLATMGRYQGARNAYLNSLNCALHPQDTERAHQMLTWIDQQLASSHSVTSKHVDKSPP